MTAGRRPLGPPATATVVGNGVVGLSVALALQDRGTAVTIVAPDTPWRGASWGNAGHIAVEQVEPLASLAALRSAPGRLFLRGGALALPPRDIAAWLPFAARMVAASGPARFARGKAALGAMLATALPAWRALLAGAGAGQLLQEDGHFVVWETAATAAAGRARWAGADTGTATWRDVTDAEMAALGGLVAVPLAGGIRFAGSGRIADPAALGEALHARFAARGGRFEHGLASGLAPHADGAIVMLDDGRRVDGDVAVIAAGARSGALARGASLAAPLIAERGYHVEAPPRDWPATMPPVVFEDRSMIVTRFADTLRAASFVEFARPDSPPDPRKWERLDAHLRALGIRHAAPPSRWVGARPTLPDYLPAIGRSRAAPAIAYAFGHQHLGLTLAATTGAALAAALSGEAPGFDLAPFDLARFGR